jgi:hypothetical protein
MTQFQVRSATFRVMTFGLIVSFLAIPSLSRADATSGAAFLKIDPSVRNQSLGGVQPAYSFGAQAVGSNPANVCILKRTGELTASFDALQGDSNYGNVAGAFKAGGRTWAVSATQWSSGSMDKRDDTGAVTGSFSARDLASGLTVSQKLGPIRAGITAKGIQSTLATYSSAWTPAADLGVSMVVKNTLWGLSALNVGPGLKYRTEKDPLPSTVNGGGAVELGPVTVVAGATYRLAEKDTAASLGMEYEISVLTLRLGYKGETTSNPTLKSDGGSVQALSGLAMGLGVKVGNLKVDYAMNTAAAEWGMTQRVGLTWSWGGSPAKQTAAPARYSRHVRADR